MKFLSSILSLALFTGAFSAHAAIKTEVVQKNLDQPVYMASPAGDKRLFVVEQSGRIVIIENGAVLKQPFLDVTTQISSGGEQGLLGLAFHPQYATNGRFFVNFTNPRGDTQIMEYKVSATNPNVADANFQIKLLEIDQPYSNHNGGWISFGPDGFLYIGMGDGGSGGDPQNHSQNKESLLGKILRIDVNSGSPYGIPSSNPFAQGGGKPEIFAVGVRNPWRNTFDGDFLYLADVGQGEWEEISVIKVTDAGANLGWPIMEGKDCYRPSSGCSRTGLKLPVTQYDHDTGCSITGGIVYRGTKISEIKGQYFYSDFCSGFVRSFTLASGTVAGRPLDYSNQLGDVGNVTSFGVDSEGEMYIMNSNGDLLKVVKR